MKALVLAGGHATRLWPITKNVAKPLLPLDGRPIIDYIVSDLEDNDDVEEVLISTNDKFFDDFVSYTEEYGYDKVRVISEDQASEEEKPGTIGAIIKILDEEGADDYLIIGGDNYYSFDIQDFLAYSKDRNVIACYELDSLEQASSFGIMDVDEENTIIDFAEKPDEPRSRLASTACYFFREEDISVFHDYLDHFQDSSIPEDVFLDEPGRLIEWAHQRIDIQAYPFDGQWFDVGTRAGYLAAQAALMDGENRIEGEVIDSKLEGNVWVMEGARVEASWLKNCIVFPDAVIYDSRVENSIIHTDAVLRDLDLNESVVGEHSRLGAPGSSR